MVFRGRPSKGCGECRRKKIRVRPSCSQCLRSKDRRPCPGYRDEQSLQFFDESSHVAQKARAKQAQAKQALKVKQRQADDENRELQVVPFSSEEPDPLLWFGSDPSHLFSPKSPSSIGLAPSIESQGIKFFMANYAMPDTELCSGHLQNLLSTKTTQSHTLQTAMAAVGLAGLSNQRKDASLMSRARENYSLAIRLTQERLEDSERCREGRTITSVALLALFETMTANSPQSIKTWMNHINGTIALLNFRGEELLECEFGIAIFTQARIQALIYCFQVEAAVPPIILRLGKKVAEMPYLSNRIANQILDRITDLCDMRARIKAGTLSDPQEIITRALEIERLTVAWATERSTYWDYTTTFILASDPLYSQDDIYDGHFAVYSALWIAGTWNIYRSTRIFIHEAILTQVDILLTQPQSAEKAMDLLSQRARSLAVIHETAADVCASIPYLLNHHKTLTEQVDDPPRAAAGYFVLTSLYLAGSTIGVPHAMRLYALSRLRYIGYRMGLGQALLLAEILAGKIEESGRSGGVGSQEIQGVPRQVGFLHTEGKVKWEDGTSTEVDQGFGPPKDDDELMEEDVMGRYATPIVEVPRDPYADLDIQ